MAWVALSCIYGHDGLRRHWPCSWTSRRDMDRDQVIHELIDIQYDPQRLRAAKREHVPHARRCAPIVPAPYADHPIRIEFWGDEIRVHHRDRQRDEGEVLSEFEGSRYYLAGLPLRDRASEDGSRAGATIHDELRERLQQFKEEGKLLEAQRLEMRVNYDLEMLETMNFCSGHRELLATWTDAEPGEPPYTLIDYFPKDFFTIIDESHVTVPQIRGGMHEGDRSP